MRLAVNPSGYSIIDRDIYQYGVWTKLTADQPRGKNLSHYNNNTAITKTKKEKIV